MKVSVIICCYNSEKRIGPTLEHLIRQKIDPTVRWEVLLVDNNCDDQTVSLAQKVWNRPDVRLRLVEEPRPGISYARLAAVRSAKGEYVLFCDDDNWLDAQYLQQGIDFLSENHEYAAIGGWGDIVCDSDVSVPDWFEDYKTKFACGKTRKEGEVDNLIGAGLFSRRSALLDLYESGFIHLLSDRSGSGLVSGGDVELTMALRIKGWKLYFSEDLFFRHYMPQNRLTEDYLIRMCHGHAQARPILSEYRRLLKSGMNSGSVEHCFSIFKLLIKLTVISTTLAFNHPDRGSLRKRVNYAFSHGTQKGLFKHLKERPWLVKRRILRIR